PPGERSQRHRLPDQQRDDTEAERGPASPMLHVAGHGKAFCTTVERRRFGSRHPGTVARHVVFLCEELDERLRRQIKLTGRLTVEAPLLAASALARPSSDRSRQLPVV